MKIEVPGYHTFYASAVVLALVGFFFSGAGQLWVHTAASSILLVGSLAQRDHEGGTGRPNPLSGSAAFLLVALGLSATKATPTFGLVPGEDTLVRGGILILGLVATIFGVSSFSGERREGEGETTPKYLWRFISDGGVFIALAIWVAFTAH